MESSSRNSIFAIGIPIWSTLTDVSTAAFTEGKEQTAAAVCRCVCVCVRERKRKGGGGGGGGGQEGERERERGGGRGRENTWLVAGGPYLLLNCIRDTIQPESCHGDDPQCALRPHKEICQIVPSRALPATKWSRSPHFTVLTHSPPFIPPPPPTHCTLTYLALPFRPAVCMILPSANTTCRFSTFSLIVPYLEGGGGGERE